MDPLLSTEGWAWLSVSVCALWLAFCLWQARRKRNQDLPRIGKYDTKEKK